MIISLKRSLSNANGLCVRPQIKWLEIFANIGIMRWVNPVSSVDISENNQTKGFHVFMAISGIGRAHYNNNSESRRPNKFRKCEVFIKFDDYWSQAQGSQNVTFLCFICVPIKLMTAINLIHRALRKVLRRHNALCYRATTYGQYCNIHCENIIKENKTVTSYSFGAGVFISQSNAINLSTLVKMPIYLYIFSITSIQPENYNKQFSPFDIGGAARTGNDSIYTLLGIRLINLCSLTYYNFCVFLLSAQ